MQVAPATLAGPARPRPPATGLPGLADFRSRGCPGALLPAGRMPWRQGSSRYYRGTTADVDPTPWLWTGPLTWQRNGHDLVLVNCNVAHASRLGGDPRSH